MDEGGREETEGEEVGGRGEVVEVINEKHLLM